MARDERDERTGGAETLRGVVEATNEKGIKIGERWVNYSQFRQVPRPVTGQEVEVELDKGRFINALTVVGGADGGALEPDEPEGLTGDAFEGLASDPAPAARAQRAATATATGRPADRNTEIRRLALLKAAAEYAAPRAEMTADDVLAVAILWEAWITESAD
ncbi:MAG: hypothetical protein M3442_01170 [Chloroflexota bacterium]|nr:hypothetical protein [Chloroflexota bacterium]